MNDDERKRIIELLQGGEALSREWIPVLFPAEKQECELAYAGKTREADILAETMAVPLQCTRRFSSPTACDGFVLYCGCGANMRRKDSSKILWR